MERRRAGKAGKRARRVVGVCGRVCGKAGKGAEAAGEGEGCGRGAGEHIAWGIGRKGRKGGAGAGRHGPECGQGARVTAAFGQAGEVDTGGHLRTYVRV